MSSLRQRLSVARLRRKRRRKRVAVARRRRKSFPRMFNPIDA
jgi:hypothetical protein